MSIFEQFKAKTTERTEEPKELSKKNNVILKLLFEYNIC